MGDRGKGEKRVRGGAEYVKVIKKRKKEERSA